MIDKYVKRHIRFTTVENPTAWVVYAILLETRGGETVALSEPRVVKVIPKAQFALPGRDCKKTYCLTAPKVCTARARSNIPSPFVSVFSYSNNDTLVWYSARPPTC